MIVVKSQEELNQIPVDTDEQIYIEFGTPIIPAVVDKQYRWSVVARGNSTVEAWENSSVVAWGNSTVEARENSTVEAWGNSSVEAWENSTVEAWGNSTVEARENSSVVARGNSTVEARENSTVEAWGNSSVEAWENSTVEAWGNSSVEAWENSSVVARGNSTVEAWGNSSVEAWENSSVVARGNSTIVAWGNSTVVAWGNSTVEARENSTVEARENSTVEAWENSTVEANANVQVVDRLIGGKICLSGNARKVYMPKNIHEFMDFYGIKHDKKKAKFFKAVHKKNGTYFSNYDKNFTYTVGEIAREPKCSKNLNNNCGDGIHICYLNWALDFGKDWDDLAILELQVNINDIVMPKSTDGKVRTNSVFVEREVPLEECGLYGKILADRRRRNVQM